MPVLTETIDLRPMVADSIITNKSALLEMKIPLEDELASRQSALRVPDTNCEVHLTLWSVVG